MEYLCKLGQVKSLALIMEKFTIEELLNNLAKEGWRLKFFHMLPNESNYVMIFERRKMRIYEDGH